MAVAYDNQASITGSAVTTVTTNPFTITSADNRAAIVGMSNDNGTVSGISYTVGGVSAVAIPGCFATFFLTGSVTAPPSGSQTATASWTGAGNVVFGVMTFSGVSQTTPTNNGTVSANYGAGTLASLAITSTPGDLTVDHFFVTARTVSANTQNLGYNTANGALVASAGSYGPGTGTATHQWTISAGNGGRSDGVNMVADLPVSSANITSSAGRFIGWTV